MAAQLAHGHGRPCSAAPGMRGAAGGAGHGVMRVTSHSMGTHQASLQLRDGGARPQLALRRAVEV